MASTKQDEELEELLKLAREGNPDEPRPLNDMEKFFLTHDIKPSETFVVPFWPIYRAYRLWCSWNKKECLSKYLFRREFVKYFTKADKYGTTNQKSYFITGNIDTSEHAYWAEKKYESDEREKKERRRKQRYPHNYPEHKWTKVPKESD
jgi:hypothetical protein